MNKYPSPPRSIIARAFDVVMTARPLIATMHHEQAGFHLAQLAASDAPEPMGWTLAMAEDTKYNNAMRVGEIAFHFGIGVLIAEYVVRTTAGDFDLFKKPLETPFEYTAKRAIAALMKNANNPDKAKASPEVLLAYRKLDELLDALGRVNRDSQRAAMKQPTDWVHTKNMVAALHLVEIT